MLRRNKAVFIILFIMICIIAASAAALSNGDTIYKGVKIGGIDVGGKTINEAKTLLRPMVDGLVSAAVTLQYGNTSIQSSVKELGGKIDVDGSLQKAYNIGREGNVIERLVEVITLWKTPIDIPITYSFDRNQTVSYLNKLASKINRKPQNAVLKISGDKFQITPEKSGTAVDVKQSADRILKSLESGSKKISIIVATKEASVKASALKSINGVIGSYSTKFKPSQKARTHNLKLACQSINGFVFNPGEIFSYNEILGPREKRFGYKDAPIFVNGGVEDGTGGGICQVSSTMYNAALLANLKIIRRSPHSRPVVYAPIGRDATVAYPSVDLKIENNTKAPIYVSATISGSSVNISLYGKKIPGQSVSIVSSNHQVISPSVKQLVDGSIAPGKKVVKSSGRSGHRISTYRVVKQNNKVVKRELIATSYYRPENRVVLIGKQRPAKPAAPKPEENKPAVTEDIPVN